MLPLIILCVQWGGYVARLLAGSHFLSQVQLKTRQSSIFSSNHQSSFENLTWSQFLGKVERKLLLIQDSGQSSLLCFSFLEGEGGRGGGARGVSLHLRIRQIWVFGGVPTGCCPLAAAGARANGGVGVVVGGEGEGGGRRGGEAPGGRGGRGWASSGPCSSCSSRDHTAGAAALGPSLKHFWVESWVE